MRTIFLLGVSVFILMLLGCASVTVTKTAKGYYPPADADEIEILVTVPDRTVRDFVELATVTTQHWSTKETAKMHNSLRSKCAPLGADAVILGSSGIDYDGYYWANGVAIRYVEGIPTENNSAKPTSENTGKKIKGYQTAGKDASGKPIVVPVYE
ncbi:MAG: hypothetical protein PHF37_01105 [Phycisphaerae bacterium]|nr:hypothetical protein [Phycisphaerae bacterium]